MQQSYLKYLGVAALAAFATAGWMRQPQTASAAPPALAVPLNSFEAPAIPVHNGVYRTVGAPVPRDFPQAGPAREMRSSQERSSRARYRDPELRQRQVAEREPAARDEEDRSEPQAKKRSTMKSVAIIGGGAAAGAAIGGLAGGGKGAAIGALGGGAAGLIYDRMTKNR
jgi:hypothetical protein